MNENKIYAAISGIDEDILAASENAGAVKASFRAAKRKKTAAVLSLCACLLLVAVAAGMRSDTKKQIKKYTETVTPRPANYAALPVDVQNTVYAFNPDDLFSLSGFSDHIAVVYVSQVRGTVYQNVRMDEGTLKGTPYTSYEVQILKNIKGALKTDVTVPLLQYGGVTIDGARVAYISALLEQNRSYVLYLTAAPDGNLYVTKGYEVPGGNTAEGCRALLDGQNDFFEPYYNAFLNENTDYAPAVRYPSPYDMPAPTTPIPVSTEVPETQTEAPDSFPYSSLTADGHTLKIFRGAGMLDIAAFSEDFLQHAELIIEGTVTDTHTKQYYFVCEAEGKFEYAGQKMMITYKPETIVTIVRIEKIWKGNDSIAVGDTVTFEDEIVGMDGVFGYHTGITYLLHLDQADEENLLVMTGQTPDEPLIEGDNHREFRYRNGYPFQPAIEKTAASDYIVPGTWKTVAQPGDVDVSLDTDIDGWEPENAAWYLLGGLKLVPSDQFEARMHELFERMGTEYMDAEE